MEPTTKSVQPWQIATTYESGNKAEFFALIEEYGAVDFFNEIYAFISEYLNKTESCRAYRKMTVTYLTFKNK